MFSMEFGETVSRDKNENVEAADIEEIEKSKSALINPKEKVTVKALAGKRKDQKQTSFRWTTYLRVSSNTLSKC